MLDFILPLMTHWQHQVTFKLLSLNHFSQQEWESNPSMALASTHWWRQHNSKVPVRFNALISEKSHFWEFFCSSSQANTILPTHVPKVNLLGWREQEARPWRYRRSSQPMSTHQPHAGCPPTAAPTDKEAPRCAAQGEDALQNLLVTPLMSPRSATGRSRPYWTWWWDLEISKYLKFKSLYK